MGAWTRCVEIHQRHRHTMVEISHACRCLSTLSIHFVRFWWSTSDEDKTHLKILSAIAEIIHVPKKICTSTLMAPAMEDVSSTKSSFDISNFIFAFVIHVPTVCIWMAVSPLRHGRRNHIRNRILLSLWITRAWHVRDRKRKLNEDRSDLSV